VIPMAEKTWHLFREFPSAPYLRWACALVEDPNTDDGYRIVDHDPMVADGGLLGGLAFHMRRPQRIMTGEVEDGVIFDGLGTVNPGEPGYFQSALMTLAGTLVGSGRQL